MKQSVVGGTEVRHGSRNVYADLGYADALAMKRKAGLVSKIADLVKARHHSPARAAQITGLPQPTLSAALRGQFRALSESTLKACVAALRRQGSARKKAFVRASHVAHIPNAKTEKAMRTTLRGTGVKRVGTVRMLFVEAKASAKQKGPLR